MKSAFTLALLSLIGGYAIAQKNEPVSEQKKSAAVTSGKVLKKVISLQMPLQNGQDFAGKRGASVAWHPIQKKYYAAIAGNSRFPLAIFDSKGKRLTADTLKTQRDIRGLWYEPASKSIQGNTYKDSGWFSYNLNAKGMVTGFKTIRTGINQPNYQSVGAFNSKSKEVIFLSDGQLYKYPLNRKNDNNPSDSLMIVWDSYGNKFTEDDIDNYAALMFNFETPEEYNSYTVLYTGIPGAELGFLHIYNNQIDLFNIKDGLYTKSILLPQGTATEGAFNLAYCNGIYWIFNMETRFWDGYK